MMRSFYLFGIIFFTVSISISAQTRELSGDETTPPGLRRPLVVDINARVVEEQQVVVWSESHRKISIPGSPVGIQLVGSNVVVSVQFTPFIRRHGNVLVAQGQIWLADANTGEVTYFTSIQTIPMTFGEPVFFFPLGSSEHLNPSIEVILTVNLYNEAGALAGRENDR
jgi:hypothetical protein